MTYIVLAAGKGDNLSPLTLKFPKTSYKLDESTTVLQKMVRAIRKHDEKAEIVVVVGYLSDKIRGELLNDNVTFVFNPFYEVTNSISSLWFARDYLERDNVAIMHGDVVFDEKIVAECLTKTTEFPYVLVDSSRAEPGQYNAVIKDDKILVMSKKLENASARYACLAKFDAVTARLLKQEIDVMLQMNMYDQYFENAIVQMIMFHNLELRFVDVKNHQWSEINTVDDLLCAKEIC